MLVTLKNALRQPVTVQYPEQRLVPSRRIRGNELVWNNVKCTGCSFCSRTCPQGAIRMVTSVDPSSKKNKVTTIQVDTGYCISCGLCVEGCPPKALSMGYNYELAAYKRDELVQAGEALFASPARQASGYLSPEVEAKLPKQSLLVGKIEEPVAPPAPQVAGEEEKK
jgi:formate hydrogenlyase subunit 6/NADH:ubiquinone oxidoreductase subunit I